MNLELREALGKAAYEAVPRSKGAEQYLIDWDSVDEAVRERYRVEAEAVVSGLAVLLLNFLATSIVSRKDIEEIIRSMK